MTVAAAHRIALVATAALPALGLVSGSPLLAAAATALIASVLFAVPTLYDHRRSRARIWAVHGFTLLGLAGALAIFPSARIDAGLCIVMLGLFNRFLLRSSQRDDLIIVGSASVLLAAATIVTPGFAFALILLGFVPAALWAMLTASILGLAERVPDREARPAVFARLARRPVPALRGAVTGWGLALMLLGYVAVSFLPRARFGHILSPGGLLTFDGAGGEMRLDAGGVRSVGGGGVVLRITPGPGVDGGDLEGLYARVYALDGTDGARFLDRGGAIRRLPRGPRDRSDRWVRLRLARLVPRDAPHPVAAIGRRGPTRVFLRKPERRESGTWVTRIPQASLDIEYEASLVEPAPLGWPTDPEERAREEARFLELPADIDPRIPALARRLAEGAEDRPAIVRRVLRHFDRGFSYTLDPIEGPSDDPVARFLFDARRGHCELYAGAVALLLRAAGVPARVASGYYGGWYNRRGRFLEMGAEDAHAWVEVLTEDGWAWVDATPADARARRQQKRLAWLLDFWDAAEALWYEHVIDFDEERRREALGALGARARTFSSELAGWLRPGGEAARTEPPLALVAVGLGVLVVGVLGSGLYARRRRGLERAGARLRRRMDPGDGPRLPLGVLADRQPEAVRSLARAAVARYEAARFGPPDQAPRLAEVEAAVRAWERAARAQTSRSSSG